MLGRIALASAMLATIALAATGETKATDRIDRATPVHGAPADRLDISGDEPATPLPPKDPCPACTYNVGNKRLNGVLTRDFIHTYPLSNMKLSLFNSAGTLIAGPFNLSPSSASGNQSITQSIPTSVSFGVARAVFSYHTSDGYDLTQDLIVR